jgi:RHS repeat-associated protein
VSLDGTTWLTYDYDDASRLDKIHRGTAIFDFGYDDAHRRTSLDFPNLVHTAHGYDTLSRVLSVVATRGQTAIASSNYTYDDAGNRLTKTHPGSYSEAYVYDPLDRLREVTRGSTVTEQYTYDKVGNRNRPPWTYSDRNELLSSGSATFTYDLRGNRTTRVEGAVTWTYEWNAEDQLTRVLSNGTEVARYKYDPLGRRVQKVVGTDVHAWLYDGEDILRESEGGITFGFVHGPGIDEALARQASTGVVIYGHADGLGSGIKVTNSLGQVIFTRQYDAFGNLEVGASQGSYAFTGREWDPETGLYYYRARYYDPKIGRFISEDPIGFHGGDVNLYGYVRNNPVNRGDPSGFGGPDEDIIIRQTLFPPRPADYRSVTCNLGPLSFNAASTPSASSPINDGVAGVGLTFPKSCGCSFTAGFVLTGAPPIKFLTGPSWSFGWFQGIGAAITVTGSLDVAVEIGVGVGLKMGGRSQRIGLISEEPPSKCSSCQ